jgi:hypothetical protein
MRFKIDKTKSITHNDYWRYEFRKPNSNPLLARLKRIFKFIINSLLLNKFGFRLVQVQKTPSFKTEQWSFTNNKEILFLRNQRIVDHLINFGFEFGLNFEKAQLHKNIERYDEIFRMGKISDLNGGMGYNNGLLLYIILTYFNPQVVLESGVWRGFTTFLIDDATQDFLF